MHNSRAMPQCNFRSVIIMGGGKGTRLGNSEKGMLQINGRPIVDSLFEFFANKTDFVLFCGSRNTPLSSKRATDLGMHLCHAIGDDYRVDLRFCLEETRRLPALVVPSDLYILDRERLSSALAFAISLEADLVTLTQEGSFTGVSVFRKVPVNDDALEFLTLEVPGEFGVNINTTGDLKRARSH